MLRNFAKIDIDQIVFAAFDTQTSDIVGTGLLTVQFDGISNSIDVLDGYRRATSSPTPYTVDGGVLTYSFAGQTFTFTRSG